MNVGSLFSGIGGFDLGLERAGMHTSWFCEQDEFCQRVLARHWPGVPCYPDVSELHNPESVDVICGGFPCQDISLAGKGAGIDGARSGLWGEMWRLIRSVGPRYVIVENVPALTSRGLDRVLRDLASGGYDAEWDCLPASAFGAPHRRDRIWIVAYPQGGTDDRRAAPNADRGRHRSPHEEVRAGRQGSELFTGAAPDPALERPEQRGVVNLRTDSEPEGGEARPLSASGGLRGREIRGAGAWESEPRLARLVHGVPDRLDKHRRHALGNALVPQIAEWIGSRVMDYERRQNPVRW